MKVKAAIPIIALLSVPAPALAQTNGATTPATPSPTTPNATGEDLGTLPESMQIEQRVQRQFYQQSPNGPNTTENQPSTDAPGGARSPVERNRLDPAAPGRHRLQIDEGQAARAIQNPSESTPQTGPSNPGTTYNTIIEGAPSSSGTGTGTSGTAGTTSTMPSTSPGVGGTGAGGLSSGTSSGGLSGGAASGASGGGSQ